MNPLVIKTSSIGFRENYSSNLLQPMEIQTSPGKENEMFSYVCFLPFKIYLPPYLFLRLPTSLTDWFLRV